LYKAHGTRNKEQGTRDKAQGTSQDPSPPKESFGKEPGRYSYRYLNGFLRAERIYLLMLSQKARTKYTINGDPSVRNEI